MISVSTHIVASHLPPHRFAHIVFEPGRHQIFQGSLLACRKIPAFKLHCKSNVTQGGFPSFVEICAFLSVCVNFLAMKLEDFQPLYRGTVQPWYHGISNKGLDLWSFQQR